MKKKNQVELPGISLDYFGDIIIFARRHEEYPRMSQEIITSLMSGYLTLGDKRIVVISGEFTDQGISLIMKYGRRRADTRSFELDYNGGYTSSNYRGLRFHFEKPHWAPAEKNTNYSIDNGILAEAPNNVLDSPLI